MKKIVILFALGFASCTSIAQPRTETTELGPLNGETENFERARDQLFGNWDWVAHTKNSILERPTHDEKYRVSFDRSGKVTISLNGKVVNGTTYSLMEDDARLVFSNWDAPQAFKIDEGPFDFDNNILWIRGEYNDRGATWQLVKAGTQVYSPIVNQTTTTTAASTQASRPAPRRATSSAKKKHK